jgi:hypothetical protein
MITCQKVGGIRFVAIGQFGCSFYISKKREPLLTARVGAFTLAALSGAMFGLNLAAILFT